MASPCHPKKYTALILVDTLCTLPAVVYQQSSLRLCPMWTAIQVRFQVHIGLEIINYSKAMEVPDIHVNTEVVIKIDIFV